MSSASVADPTWSCRRSHTRSASGTQTPVAERLVGMIGQRGRSHPDSFEQVADAAPHLTDILATCPNLTILVTSRTVLHHGRAHRALPRSRSTVTILKPRRCRSSERAAAANSSFEVSDGNLPDIIDLRASRRPAAGDRARRGAYRPHLARALCPARRQPRLCPISPDVHPRLRTMRDAIDWSYHLLDEPEQRLFTRLAIFVGGFSIDAARAVGFTRHHDDWEAIDRISSLMDQSLIEQQDGPNGEPRFTMLETIREYGLRHLAERDELEDTRRRHAEWCLAFAQDIHSSFAYQQDAIWRDRLESELGNLRAALRWHATRDAVEDLLALASALFPLWYHPGAGGRRRYRRSLEAMACRPM